MLCVAIKSCSLLRWAELPVLSLDSEVSELILGAPAAITTQVLFIVFLDVCLLLINIPKQLVKFFCSCKVLL